MLGLNDMNGNDLADSFNSHRLHHHRRFLKTVIRVHRLTIIVPQHYHHLHIVHLLSRVSMYPGGVFIDRLRKTFAGTKSALVIG